MGSQSEFSRATLQHFADIESAEIRDKYDLTDRYNSSHIGRSPPDEVSQHMLMTLNDLVESFADGKKGRAGGPDSNLDDTFKLAPEETALHWYPVILKTIMRGREPIQFKAGIA
eukprot:2516667-Pyramimonas_sp.AAC.1